MLSLQSELWSQLTYIDATTPATLMPVSIQKLTQVEEDPAYNESFMNILGNITDSMIHINQICQLSIAVIPYLIVLITNNFQRSIAVIYTIECIIFHIKPSDLNQADPAICQGYHDSIEKLLTILPEFCNTYKAIMSDDEKEMITFLYLYSLGVFHHKETLVSFADILHHFDGIYDDFELGECPHCSKPITCCLTFHHELPSFLQSDKTLASISHFTPKVFVPNDSVQMNDNLAVWLYTFLHNLEDTELLEMLPFLFGLCRCPHCSMNVNVMEQLVQTQFDHDDEQQR